MLLILTLAFLLAAQTYDLYSIRASGNALNDKWRMFETAKNDVYFDRNSRYFMLSATTTTAAATTANRNSSKPQQ